jgi:hypothetical protein
LQQVAFMLVLRCAVKAFSLALLVLLMPATLSAQSRAGSQTQAPDKRLMTDADYKAFLLQVEAALPKWETQLKSIDLEKVPQISYSRGKSIADQRNLGLVEIGNIRLYLTKLQSKRTVSGELALFSFMRGLFDVGEEIVWEEIFSGVTLTSLEKYVPELSALEIRIGNDVNARVALLEKDTCP